MISAAQVGCPNQYSSMYSQDIWFLGLFKTEQDLFSLQVWVYMCFGYFWMSINFQHNMSKSCDWLHTSTSSWHLMEIPQTLSNSESKCALPCLKYERNSDISWRHTFQKLSNSPAMEESHGKAWRIFRGELPSSRGIWYRLHTFPQVPVQYRLWLWSLSTGLHCVFSFAVYLVLVSSCSPCFFSHFGFLSLMLFIFQFHTIPFCFPVLWTSQLFTHVCQEGYDLSKRPMVDLLLVVADEAQSGEGVIGFGIWKIYWNISG